MMDSNAFIQLNAEAIRLSILNQDLKCWWVAEQAGVHRTTLRRWISGNIQKVRAQKVSELARVLCVETAAIVQTDKETAFPSPA